MSGPDRNAAVGFIGLGDMGAAMALNLIDRGWPMVLYARREATLAPFRATAATIVASPAEVGRTARFLCLCVVDEHQIEEILFGANGAAETLAPGAIVLVHSTVSPESCRRFAARLQERGVALIDAPVTGAAERGRNGTLTIPVGGAPDAVAQAMPLLTDEGANVVHLGDVGAGQIGKLLNNALFIVQTSLVDEMMKLGGAMGLDAARVLDVIDTGTAASWASGFTRRMVTAGKPVFAAYDTTYPGGVEAIVRKDIGLFLGQLEQTGLQARRMAGIAAGAVDAMAVD